MTRKRVRLQDHGTAVQYAVALLIVATVVAVAVAGGIRQPPGWFTHVAAPVLGVAAILVAGWLIATRRR